MARSRRLLIPLVAVLAWLAGCGTVSAINDTEKALTDDGFRDVTISFAPTDIEIDRFQMSASRHQDLRGIEAVERAEEIVWNEFPRRFDRLEVRVGTESGAADRAELEARFGPRDPELDDKSIGDDVEEGFRLFGIGAAIVAGLGVLSCIGVIVLIVVLVTRSSRKRREQWVWYPPPPPGGYGQQ